MPRSKPSQSFSFSHAEGWTRSRYLKVFAPPSEVRTTQTWTNNVLPSPVVKKMACPCSNERARTVDGASIFRLPCYDRVPRLYTLRTLQGPFSYMARSSRLSKIDPTIALSSQLAKD